MLRFGAPFFVSSNTGIISILQKKFNMKKSLFLILFIIITNFSFSQNLDSTALILIDIQDFYFPGGAVELVEPEKAGEQAKKS